MIENKGFHSKGVKKRGFSSLDALMGTLLTGALVSGYRFMDNIKSPNGEYDLFPIILASIVLGVGVVTYSAIRYIGATDTHSNINNYDSNSRFMAQTALSEYDNPPY